MKKLRVFDTFSGIGGFSLGLERTGGFETVAFCEIDPYARRVLHKHWPDVPCYEDIREVTYERLQRDGITDIDVITGGFPCQDISCAGKGEGLDGEHSRLYFELNRLIGEIRPAYVIMENSPRLLTINRGRDLGRILGEMAKVFYDAQGHCIPAASVGAKHKRDRLWIVAIPYGKLLEECIYPGREEKPYSWIKRSGETSGVMAHSLCSGFQGDHWRRTGCITQNVCQDVPNTMRFGRKAGISESKQWHERFAKELVNCRDRGEWRARSGRWTTEPAVGRVAYGVPARVDRLRGLGNAVVPDIPELIGKAILEVA